MELFFDAAGGYPFTTTSSALPGVVRKFNSVADCVEEICDSRLYGGIHFLHSNDRATLRWAETGRLALPGRRIGVFAYLSV